MLIPVIGLPTLYLLDAISLLATLWATWRLPPMPPEPCARRRAGLREVVAGFRYAALHKVLLVSFLIDVVAMGFGMPRALFPEMAQKTFGDPPGGGLALGLLFAAIPIGMVVAGLFSGWLHADPPPGRRGGVSICVWGLGVALFGLTGSLWLAVLAPRRRRGGRPGQLGVPLVDAADRRHRRDARPDAGRVHRRRRRGAAGGRPVARLGGRRHRPGPAATVGGFAVIVGIVAVVVAVPGLLALPRAA